MKKILISSCLLGENVKYNGKNNLLPQNQIKLLEKNFALIPVCPEVMGGLSIPRTPAEAKKRGVFNQNGEEITAAFTKGAEKTLRTAVENSVKAAILKERSPSCGVHFIYDGSFSKKIIAGKGITTKLLVDSGIAVFSEDEISECIRFLSSPIFCGT